MNPATVKSANGTEMTVSSIQKMPVRTGAGIACQETVSATLLVKSKHAITMATTVTHATLAAEKIGQAMGFESRSAIKRTAAMTIMTVLKMKGQPNLVLLGDLQTRQATVFVKPSDITSIVGTTSQIVDVLRNDQILLSVTIIVTMPVLMTLVCTIRGIVVLLLMWITVPMGEESGCWTMASVMIHVLTRHDCGTQVTALDPLQIH